MIFIFYYNDIFTSHWNNTLTQWGFKRQSLQVNLSFEQGYPHTCHEIVDLSVHWLPAYKDTAFAMLSISDADHVYNYAFNYVIMIIMKYKWQ